MVVQAYNADPRVMLGPGRKRTMTGFEATLGNF